MTEFDAKALVDKGFNLLTEDLGPDWVNDVDLDALDVVSLGMCPLGQLYGRYEAGRDHLADVAGVDRWHFSRQYGFDSPNVTDEEYAALTDEWKRRITEARKLW